MKSKVKRIFKVLSCFLVIVVVLLASVTMPVFAADRIYQMSDIFSGVEAKDDTIITYYDLSKLSITPFWNRTLNGVNQGNVYGIVCDTALPSGTSNSVYSFTCNPLGGPAHTTAYGMYVLSLQDLEHTSYLQFSFRGCLDGSGLKIGGDWCLRGSLSLAFYDVDGTFVKDVSTPTQSYDTSSESEEWLFDFTLHTNIPDGACYVAPALRYELQYDSLLGGSYFRCEYISGSFYTSLDSVVVNSLTMQRIEDQIGDVSDQLDDIQGSINDSNEKLDTVIDGTPEMNNAAQDNSLLQDELDQDLNNAMDDFDNKSDPDNILPDNSFSSDELESITHDFSSSDAWNIVKQIFGRVLSNEGISEILMLVIGFINISVLLLGR